MWNLLNDDPLHVALLRRNTSVCWTDGQTDRRTDVQNRSISISLCLVNAVLTRYNYRVDLNPEIDQPSIRTRLQWTRISD